LRRVPHPTKCLIVIWYQWWRHVFSCTAIVKLSINQTK
jgi:hypothetical protein